MLQGYAHTTGIKFGGVGIFFKSITKMEVIMSKMVRLNFSDELHRSLMIHAAIHNERAKNLVASATLNLVEAGRLPGDVPVTALTNAIRPVVTEFSDDEFQRIDDFAGRVGFSVTHLMRIAVALKYANVEFAGMQQ